jgi:dihydroneopterin triphosphate diphosphatase
MGDMPKIEQEIPIRSFSISAYIARVEDGEGRYLLLKRRSKYLEGTWQQISGLIQIGETGWQAALREIREETGLVPSRFYSANQTEVFYERRQNCINVVPVFVGFVEGDVNVALSAEHGDYRWVAARDAHEFLTFNQQVATIEHLEEVFVRNTPPELLRIGPME